MRRTCFKMILVVAMMFLLLASDIQAKKVTTITFWTPLTTKADKDIHAQLIKNFEKKHPNIKVVPEYVSHSDWFVRWMTAISSKQMPDLALLDNGQASWLYEKGLSLPLEDLVKEIDPDKKEFVYSKSDILAFQTPDGHIWAIPYTVNVNTIWYRKDLLAKAGISPESIKTWDDLFYAAKKASNPPEVYGIGMALARELAAQQMLFVWTNANNGNFFDPKTGAYLVDQPETRKKVKEALEFLKKLYDNRLLPPGVSTWMWNDYRLAMAKGKLVFTSSWGGDIGVARDQNPAMLDNLGVMPHPSGPSADGYPPYHDAGAWAWALIKNDNKDKIAAAKEWLRFFFQPDNVALATTARPVYNIPVLKSVLKSKVFLSDPTTKKFIKEINFLYSQILPTTRRVGQEAGPTPIIGLIQAELFPSDAVHNYLFNGWDIDKTIDYLDTNFKKLFKNINYPYEKGPFGR